MERCKLLTRWAFEYFDQTGFQSNLFIWARHRMRKAVIPAPPAQHRRENENCEKYGRACQRSRRSPAPELCHKKAGILAHV